MRHLLLSLLLASTGCSLIRVSGLPFGRSQSNQAASSASPGPAATPQPKEVEPTPLAVPGEGLVRRIKRMKSRDCNPYRLNQYAVVAVLELAAPVTDWTLRATSDGLVRAIVLPENEPISGCPKQDGKVNLAAGRYRVAVTWEAGSDNPDWMQTIAFFPGQPNPLLHDEVPAVVPEKERALDLWYPFVQDQAQALELAPRQLFVFAKPGETATVWYRTSISSTWNDKPAAERLTLGSEPLLRHKHNYDTFIATDLTELQHAKTIEAPEGALVLPGQVRGSWLGMDSLMSGAVDPLKQQVETFKKQWNTMENCVSGAIGRYNAATVNVIISPNQRAAASERLAKDRKFCRTVEVYAARDALKEKLLEARRARVQQQAEAVRPRLTAMFQP